MGRIKAIKKLISPVLAAALIISSASIISASAQSINLAVYSNGNMDITGSASIKGDAIITTGKLTGGSNRWATGYIYTTNDVDTRNVSDNNKPIIKMYSGEVINYTFKDYKNFPETTYFMEKNTNYKDGTKDLIIGSSDGEEPSGYTLSADSFIRQLKISPSTTLNIDVPAGQLRVIRADSLEMRGDLVIRGGGKVVLYADKLKNSSNGLFNATYSGFGDTKKLTLIIGKENEESSLANARISANIICLDNKITLANTKLKGNFYTRGYFTANGTASITGLVFAPASKSKIEASANIIGRLITRELTISGNSYVQYGEVSGLPSDVAEFIGDKNDGQIFNQETPTPSTTQSTSTTHSSQPTQTTQTTKTTGTTQSTQPEQPGDGDQGEVTITVTVARRMSIRLEDGTILKNNDKFKMPKYGTIRYQICTNNWDTDAYTDDGQGIAGQKVFEYTHQRNKELYLRVDNLRHFMPVRFSFLKGNYNKQTGVDNVLSTPLESLSINLPLGATVNVKAYLKYKMIESKNIFIDSNLEWHYWDY
jgi:hypothetical protein